MNAACPSTEHHQCHKCYNPSMFGVQDVLTVDWFPQNVPFSKVSADDYLRQMAADMLTLIQDKIQHQELVSFLTPKQ